MKFNNIKKIFFCIIMLVFAIFPSNIFAAQKLNLSSTAAIAMDADSSLVLYEKNSNKKIYPASTTKILTAILAIENLELKDSAVVSKTALDIPWDSSTVYLRTGEILTIEDLLYCLLLNSGNDAANVLAEAVSGSIDKFVDLMNQKIKEIGCTNTHFNNAHGYSDNNHYTTALDMAKILDYCIENETFVKIMSTKSYTVAPTNKTKTKRILSNTNRLILKKEDSVYSRYYSNCIGGKTGYTDEAGRTLVTFGKKDGKTVIVAVFDAAFNGSEDLRYTDAINLFEYSFNNFTKQTIAKAENYSFNYINTNKNLNYSVALKEDFNMLWYNNQAPDCSYTINIDDSSLEGIDKDNFKELPVGTVTFKFKDLNNNELSHSENLYLKDIERYTLITKSNITWIIVLVSVIVLIALISLLVIKATRKTSISKSSRKERRK